MLKTLKTIYRICFILLSTLILGTPVPAAAHAGIPNAQTIVQQFAGSELTITIHAPQRLPGALQLDVVLPGSTEYLLYFSAAPRTQPMPMIAQGQIRILPTQPGPYYLQLPIEQAGEWDLLITLAGNEQTTRIPFMVPVPTIDPTELALKTSFALLAACLIIGFGSVFLSIRFRSLVWLPIIAGVVAAVLLGIAISLAVQTQARPPVAATGRPFASLMLASVPAQPQAGQPVTLKLNLVDGSSGQAVDDLMTTHEALAHLLIISSDQHFFLHSHPTRIAAGQYVITFTPEHAGNYWLYLEIARQDSGSQVLRYQFVVAGEPAKTAPVPGLGPQQIGPMAIVTSVSQQPVLAGRTTTLRMHVAVAGKPLDAFQPWLGMAGHAIVQGADGAVFGHVHAAESMAYSNTALQPQAGPELTFNYIFPTAGNYMVWLQFKYQGYVWTVPVRLEVQ
jgi:hypothetical protein